jgi:hypothetical protein
MKEKQMIIGNYENEIDAEIAKGRLESSGILSFIFKDDGGGMIPSLQNAEGVHLIVSESHAAEAAKVLQNKVK